MNTFNSRIGILAPTLYGKSYLARNLIENKIIPFYKSKPYSANSYKILIYNTDEEDEYNNLADKYSKYIVVKNNDDSNPDFKELSFLNKWLLSIEAEYYNSIILIDDLDIFFSSNRATSKFSGELKNIFSAGRHQGLGVIFMTKTPRYLPKIMFTNSELLYIGYYDEKEDYSVLPSAIPTKLFSSVNNHIFIRFNRLKMGEERIKLVKV